MVEEKREEVEVLGEEVVEKERRDDGRRRTTRALADGR